MEVMCHYEADREDRDHTEECEEEAGRMIVLFGVPESEKQVRNGDRNKGGAGEPVHRDRG